MDKSQVTQAIKARLSIADIVRRYVDLKRQGTRLVAPCPFHQETKPSFSVNEEQGTFYCFGCQASGDIFDFYGKINGFDFKESLEALAEEAGVKLEHVKGGNAGDQAVKTSNKREILKMHALASALYAKNLTKQEAEPCRVYMEERGLPKDMVERFAIGYSLPAWQDLADTLKRSGYKEAIMLESGLVSKGAKGGVYDRFRSRLMFPIRNLSGQTIAFGGRVLPKLAQENDAKYINSSDSPVYKKGDHLYGLYEARSAMGVQKCAMLTEGYMDVITLHQFGYTHAVAGLGTALTPEQVRRISSFCPKVELLYDGDAPGRKAALKAAEMFLTRGLSCTVVLFPDKEDIDSLLRKAGKEAFEALRTKGQDGLDFCIGTLQGFSPKDAVEWARNFLLQVELPELFQKFATSLAQGLGFSEQELRDNVHQKKQTRVRITANTSDAPSKLVEKAEKIGEESGEENFLNPSPSTDKEILTFAVRYPSALAALQNLGADLFLRTPWARALWEKLENARGEEIFPLLSEVEKGFFIRARDMGAPLDNQEGELAALQILLEQLQKKNHSASLIAALRQGQADTATQMEYMRALRDARKEAL